MALAVGVLIACYTLWDKYAVAGLAIAPVALKWGTDACRAVWLGPMALRRRHELGQLWPSLERRPSPSRSWAQRVTSFPFWL